MKKALDSAANGRSSLALPMLVSAAVALVACGSEPPAPPATPIAVGPSGGPIWTPPEPKPSTAPPPPPPPVESVAPAASSAAPAASSSAKGAKGAASAKPAGSAKPKAAAPKPSASAK